VKICLSTPMSTTARLESSGKATGSRVLLPSDSSVTAGLRQNFGFAENIAVSIAPDYGQGKLGESLAAVQLSAWLASRGARVQAIPSLAMRWQDFRESNVIVFGHAEINSWVAPLLQRYPLTFGQDASRQNTILNRKPTPEEAAEYGTKSGGQRDGERVTHVLLSRLPGVDETRQLLLISGLDSQAAQAGLEFLLDEARMEERLAGHLPHFQAVLEVRVRDKVPVKSEVLLVRRVKAGS